MLNIFTTEFFKFCLEAFFDAINVKAFLHKCSSYHVHNFRYFCVCCIYDGAGTLIVYYYLHNLIRVNLCNYWFSFSILNTMSATSAFGPSSGFQ